MEGEFEQISGGYACVTCTDASLWMTLALILYIAINAKLLKHATLGKKAQASSHCEVIKSSVDCNSSIELKYYSRPLGEDVPSLPLMLFF